MDDEHWSEADAKAIAVFLAGDDLGVDQRGERITDASYFVMLNAADNNVIFTLPESRWGERWRVVFNTQDPDVPRLTAASPVTAALPEAALANATADEGSSSSPSDELHAAGSNYELIGRSVAVLERVG
jgi:pullulanase/glycogen debranching enzyme